MFTYQSNPGVYGKNAAKWPYGRLSNPEGQEPTERRSYVGKARWRQRAGSAG